jgi:hypothetical protein
MGVDTVIVKSGRRICGTGGALANAPLVQSKSYFEMKVQSGGVWGVGLATSAVQLDTVPLGRCNESWVLHSDGKVYHNREVVATAGEIPQEGDIVCVTYDHVELNFFLNGKSLNIPVTGIRGQIFPVFYVDEGAILDVSFMDFSFPPPNGFDRIMFEKSII